MYFRIAFYVLTILPLAAQVRFTEPTAGTIAVTIDGQPFTDFHSGSDAGKPFLAPLRSASGKIVTRHYPMEKIDGESRDHLHHRGLWFSYDDVNGIKFWENDPSYTKGKIGRIVVTSTKMRDGQKSGSLLMAADWNGPDGKAVLKEHRVMTFSAKPGLRIIDFDIVLTAMENVTFGDTKEGAFAIRLADSMIEKKGGHMVNAEGKSGMNAVWGHRSPWVDYSGDVDGEKVGIAIFDNPKNPRFPTYWHSRDYGLFALNPFGQKAFDKDQPESNWKLEKGKSLRFRWRVVIHEGDADAAHIAQLYNEYTHP